MKSSLSIRRLVCVRGVRWAICIHRAHSCPDRDRTLVDCRHIFSSCGDLELGHISNLLYGICPQEERLTWQTTLFLGNGDETARCYGESGKHVTLYSSSIKEAMS